MSSQSSAVDFSYSLMSKRISGMLDNNVDDINLPDKEIIIEKLDEVLDEQSTKDNLNQISHFLDASRIDTSIFGQDIS